MANGTIPGAIRWDAWYGGGTGSEGNVNTQECRTLGPAIFQSRAPWFATPVSPFLMTINGNTQAIMDAEITYAAAAGLRYWAYCWYGQETPVSPMQNAWALHQASSIKNNMNWCLNWQFGRIGGLSAFTANIPTYVGYFQQANYQTVTATTTLRPLVYCLISDTDLAAAWGNSWANVASAFTALRAACVTAGVGNPYIVFQYGSAAQAATAASFVTQAGADAISQYATGGGGSTNVVTWPTFEASVEAFWAAQVATTTPVVPLCMVGFDQRPRKITPSSALGTKPNVNLANYVVFPTPTQLTAHLQAAVSYVVANPTPCASKAILIYSWTECDEFGALIPSYNATNPAAPVTSALDAVAAVTW